MADPSDSSCGRFAGQVAIVTGASSGIGKAVAVCLAREGASLVLAARRKDKLEESAEDVKALLSKPDSADVITVVTDVSKEADNKALVEAAVDRFGKVDIAILNAGTATGFRFQDAVEDQVDTLLNTNVKSVVFALKYLLPVMEPLGKKASIVVTSSSVSGKATAAAQGLGVYSASKAAVDMLVKYAAIEAAESGIRVNSVNPGIIKTDIHGASDSDVEAFAAPVQLMGRAGTSEEVANLVLWLASSEASFVTGSSYVIDGGW
eukprot:CAMPEP_0177592984 /NCGR_PEP_ID=MMETSP0419_2-20121207/8867_1 /TAXON_ID=582737 /ORGANISM="Tetraselmis sp., Strain GSL018" /LENGTH=262 /DNA_ID=CAMNT_0019083919 /DNA_START=155 /DNA_END=940 /DNA_ORIENTATION=-